jgi:hypothetical protein
MVKNNRVELELVYLNLHKFVANLFANGGLGYCKTCELTVRYYFVKGM